MTHFFIAHKKDIRWQGPNKTIIHICMLLQLLCPGFQEKNVCSIFVDMMGKIAVDVPFQFIFYFFFSPRRRFFYECHLTKYHISQWKMLLSSWVFEVREGDLIGRTMTKCVVGLFCPFLFTSHFIFLLNRF